MTKSIPYSQALRNRRICFTDKSLKKRLGHLKIIWKEGVTNKVLSRKVLAKLITSPGAGYFSTKKNRNVKEPLVSSHTILDWEAASTPFVGIGHPSKKIPNCPKSFLSLPWLPSNNQTPNSLRNLLVRAEMSKPNTTIGKSHSCGDKRCKCCKHIYMQHSSSYTSKVTGKQYKIFCTVNCKSANVIYILECSVCGLQYIGESKQPFHERLNGHISDVAYK